MFILSFTDENSNKILILLESNPVFILSFADENSNKISILLEALVWRILIQGCFQPVAAFLFGAVCCPLSSFFIIVCESVCLLLHALSLLSPHHRPLSGGLVVQWVRVIAAWRGTTIMFFIVTKYCYYWSQVVISQRMRRKIRKENT